MPGTALIAQLLSFASIIGVPILFYIFPNGYFVPQWTRWLALAFSGFIAFEMLSAFTLEGSAVTWPVAIIVFGSMFYAQVYRYRRVSTPVQRGQTRWAMFGLLMTPLGWLLGGLPVTFFPVLVKPTVVGLRGQMIWDAASLPLYAMAPIGLTIALLRHRLYDVDVVIRRTLIYSTLTVLLAMVYFGGVALMQGGFVAITGQESPLAVVASTLAIAALFRPVRRRVQDVVDRRFFRRKYDAEKTVDAFARTVRDEVDMDRLRGELVRVVEETMQPDHVSLWLREPS
jgi:hypothetical protein